MFQLLFFLLCILNLFASNDPFMPNSPSEKAWTSSSDEFLIGGLVNPATGQFSLAETDLIAMGAQPLSLTRYYIPPRVCESYSNWRQKDEYGLGLALDQGYGWIFFPHTVATLQYGNKGIATFTVSEPDGSLLQFKMERDGTFKLMNEGPFTNSNGVSVSGAFDIRNTSCHFEDSGKLVVESKDGTVRYYVRKQRDAGTGTYDFLLQRERLPNGRLIVYKYDKMGFLGAIESKDPTGKFTYASLRREGNDWITHAGQRANYVFKTLEHSGFGGFFQYEYKFFLLTNSKSPLVNKEYHYSDRGVLVSQMGSHPLFSSSYQSAPKTLRVGELQLPMGRDGSLVAAHKMSYEFDGDWTFITATHPDKTKTSYVFNAKSFTYRIIHEGRKSDTVWDKDGHLTKIEVKGLYRKMFRADSFGNPRWEMLFGDLTGSGEGECYRVRREYDKHLLLKEVTDSGLTTTYTYLPGTNLITSKIMDGVDGLHLEEHYVYDAYNNLIESRINNRVTRYQLRSSHPHLHRVEWIEKEDRKVHLYYDAYGNVRQEDHHDSDGVFVYSIFRTHNGRGQVLSETNAIGEVCSFTYDRDGNITSRSRPKENVEYDKRGRVIHHTDALYATDYQYDRSDNIKEKTDRFGTIRYQYKDKKPIKITQGDRVTTSSYDVYGREVSRTDANGHKTRYAYNARNQVTRITLPDRSEERFIYNLDGSLKEHTDPDGNRISYEYDSFGRVIKKKYSDVGEESFIYDAVKLLCHTDLEGFKTEYFYDDLDRKIREERCGRITEYTYDSLGRVASTTKGGITTEFKYDFLDRVIAEATLHSLIRYTYDEDGNKTSISNGDSTEKFTYDPLKRLIQQEDPLGNRTTIEYSELEKRTTDPNGVITIEKQDQYENIVSKEIPGVTAFRYEYDLEGNLRKEEEDVYKNGAQQKTLTTSYTHTPKNEIDSINKYGETTTYSYTPSGKVKVKQKADGTQIQYDYDRLGYLIRVNNETFTYNKLGHLTSGTGFTREVDPFGNVLKESLANGLSITKTYDDLDRPLSMTLPTGTIYYTYDERLKSISYRDYTHAYEYNLAGHVLSSGPTSYERDAAGQITKIIAPHIDQECQYDSRGNLIFASPQTYIYDELSQFKGEFDSHFDPPNAVLTGNAKEHDGFALSYDSLDRLVAANDIEFTYDALGRRLSKNDEIYLYDGLSEIATYKDGKFYVKINGVLFDLDGTLAVPVFDGTYVLRYLVDPITHAIVNEYEFDPFGQPICVKETLYNPYRYALKHYDEETGLIYFGKRYYDSASRRWITPDPAGPIDLVNLYTFVRNNPFRYRDYAGLSAESNIGKAMGGIGHGIVDFSVGFFHELQLGSAYYGSAEIDFDTRMQMMNSVMLIQDNQKTKIDKWMMGKLSIDESDVIYNSYRSKTSLGLEIASLAYGGYGVVREVLAFSKLAKMPVQASRVARSLLKETSVVNNGIKAKQIWTSTKRKNPVQNAFGHWKDHGHEFPELLNSKQYVEQTHNFFAGSRDQLLTKIRPSGDVLLYDAQTNTFGAFTAEGVPKTMFKPTEGIVYWQTRN